MKRIFCCATLMLALFATGCGDANQKTSVLPQIDMNADYPDKEICLQDVADVSYIPLESKDDFLFRGKMEEVSSEGIAVIGDDKIYLFHPDGKARSVIDKKGQGPGEYPFVTYGIVDWKKEEVFVHLFSQNLIYVYSFSGDLKRQFKFEEKVVQHDFVDGGAGYLVMFKEKPGENKEGKVDPPYHPIVRMSKVDGRVDSLSYQQDYYTSMHLQMALADGTPYKVMVPSTSLKNLNGDVYVNEVSSDTVYRMVGEALEPVITRTPSVKEDKENKCFLMMYGLTPRHYFLRRQMQRLVYDETNQKWDYECMDKGSGWLLYDIKTGEAFTPKFSNTDWLSDVSYKYLTFGGKDANTAYLRIEAFDLIEALEAGELSGELKTVAEGLKEDDNPVLMVVKFKE